MLQNLYIKVMKIYENSDGFACKLHSGTCNYANGFDRNNQSGVVTMTNCTGDSNKKKNYNWPASGTPSALGYKVTFGKAIIDSCISKNGKNDISGATLKGNCQGF